MLTALKRLDHNKDNVLLRDYTRLAADLLALYNPQHNDCYKARLVKVKRWKSEKVKKWKSEKMDAPFKGERAKKWKGEKMTAPFKDERVKRWKGEKMAAPFKGERVKKWKGERMAAPSKDERVKKWKGEKVNTTLRRGRGSLFVGLRCTLCRCKSNSVRQHIDKLTSWRANKLTS